MGVFTFCFLVWLRPHPRSEFELSMATTIETPIRLGGLDSNQDKHIQSVLSYH